MEVKEYKWTTHAAEKMICFKVFLREVGFISMKTEKRK